MAKERPQQGAQTVDRALGILDQFTFEHPSHSLSELSKLTGLTVSTTHRLLKALQGRGFVVLDPTTRRYSIGLAVIRLAGIILDREDVHTMTVPYLREIRDITGETATLHWLVDTHRTVIAEFESPYPMRMTSGLGRTYPLHSGAAGKAILPFVRPEELEAVLEEAAEDSWPNQKRSRKALLADLEEIRERGYAMSVGEVVAGASALAAPVKDAGGHALASLNVTGPVDRWTLERLAAFAPTLLQDVATVEQQLGYRQSSPTRREIVP